MRDAISKSKGVLLLEPLDLNTNRTSANLDTRGADGVKVSIITGSAFEFTGTNKIEYRLQHSDTTTGGDFAAVTQDDVLGATVGDDGAIVAYAEDIETGQRVDVSYIGSKRYLRVLSVKGGTITNAIGTIAGELTYLHREPDGYSVES